jgi:hypothetical protein
MKAICTIPIIYSFTYGDSALTYNCISHAYDKFVPHDRKKQQWHSLSPFHSPVSFHFGKLFFTDIEAKRKCYRLSFCLLSSFVYTNMFTQVWWPAASANVKWCSYGLARRNIFLSMSSELLLFLSKGIDYAMYILRI